MSVITLNRELPWNGISTGNRNGVRIATNSREAIEQARLNWIVEKKPIFLEEEKLIPSYYANVRDKDSKVYGIVTGKYQLVQNVEAFDFMDSLYEEKLIHYDSVGSLGDGKKVALSVKLNDGISILGDDFDIYMLLLNSHDGKGAIKACVTPIRLACMNVLNLAIKNSIRSWSIQHTGNIQNKLAEAHDSIKLSLDFVKNLEETAKFLSGKKINTKQLQSMLDQLYPITEKTSDRIAGNMESLKETTLEAYEASDIAKFSGTGWGVINAVSDVISHREPIRNTSSFYERRIEGIMKGDAILDQAYNILMAI